MNIYKDPSESVRKEGVGDTNAPVGQGAGVGAGAGVGGTLFPENINLAPQFLLELSAVLEKQRRNDDNCDSDRMALNQKESSMTINKVLVQCIGTLLNEVNDLKQMVVQLLQILSQQQQQQQQNPVVSGLGLQQNAEAELRNKLIMAMMQQYLGQHQEHTLLNQQGQMLNTTGIESMQPQPKTQHQPVASFQETTTCLFQAPSCDQQMQSPPLQQLAQTQPQPQPQPQYKEWNHFLSHLQRHCAAQTAAAQAQSNPSSLTEDRAIVEDVEIKDRINVEEPVVAVAAFQDRLQQPDVNVTNSVGESSNVYQGISHGDSGEIQEDESMEECTYSQSGVSSKQRANGLNGYHCGKSLTYDLLKNYFDRPLKQAACDLGVCTTTLKRACRKVGIAAWPARQVRKLNKSLKAASNTKEVWSVVDDYVKRRLKQHGQLNATDVENLVDKCVKQEQDEIKNQMFQRQLQQCSYTDRNSNFFSGNARADFQRPIASQKRIDNDEILKVEQPLVTEFKQDPEM